MNKYTLFSISQPGISDISVQEIKEIIGSEPRQLKNAVLFSVDSISNLKKVFTHNQSLTYLSLFLESQKDCSEFSFDGIDFTKLFPQNKELSFVIDIHGVKGQDNRISLQKILYQKVKQACLAQFGKECKVDHKNPSVRFQLYDSNELFLFGVSLHEQELNKRDYRLFAHQASFKGDFAYNVLRECSIRKEESILFGFSKDGTLVVEAVYFLNNLPVRKIRRKDFFTKIPLFEDENNSSKDNLTELTNPNKVFAFDSAQGSIRASKNNIKLAKLTEYVELKQCPLEDVDMKFDEAAFDVVIFHLTRKDEDYLHEIYNQLQHLLKPKGRAYFISRKNFEMVVPSIYDTSFSKPLFRGESSYLLTGIQKK